MTGLAGKEQDGLALLATISSGGSSSRSSSRISTSSRRKEPARSHVCLECGATFGYRHVLAQHVRSHRGEKPYLCTLCNTGFVSLQILKNHAISHRQDGDSTALRSQLLGQIEAEEDIPCPNCELRFNRKGNMVRHLKHHCKKVVTAPAVDLSAGPLPSEEQAPALPLDPPSYFWGALNE